MGVSGRGQQREQRKSGSRVSIREVAARAGVSLGTVSNVLNRPQRVAPETRARVERAVRELGFVPDGSARQLRRGRSHTIGVVVLDVANPFWGEVTRGIESVTSAQEFVLILGSSDESADKEARFLHMLDERRVDGLLIAPVEDDERYLKRIEDSGTPIVLLDRISETGTLSSVGVDDVRGGEMAASHLFEQGHEQIAFVNGPVSIRWCADRRRGVLRAAAESGLDPAKAVLEVTTGSLTARAGEEAVEQFLDAAPRPTALVCANDLLALGVLRKLSEQGISVPHDVALVGYDDVDFAAVLSPPLTSVRQPAYEVGRTAAQLLLEELHTPHRRQPRQVLFQPELIARSSSGDAVPRRSARRR
jgi:LacI family transcriptional regulator